MKIVMRSRCAVIILTLLITGSTTLAGQELYPILEYGTYGFIDGRGEIAIPVRFADVGRFTEGLAPARLDGGYGYIDSTGLFVISPRFDFAEPFADGIARVVIDEIPYLIDRNGEKLFDHGYVDIDAPINDRTIVLTKGERQGVLDLQGHLVVDTIYGEISPFIDGRAIVVDDRSERERRAVGVIDTEGNLIVPIGRYEEIDHYSDGFARVGINDSTWGYIDLSGRLLITLPSASYTPLPISSFDDGHVIIAVAEDEDRFAIVNSEGDLIRIDEEIKAVTPFERGRGLARLSDRSWVLIDGEGGWVSDRRYESFREPVISNGVAYLIGRKAVRAIDMESGEELGTSEAFAKAERIIAVNGVAVAMKEEEDGDDGIRWSFWDARTGPDSPRWFDDIIGGETFASPLIGVMQEGGLSYVDRRGLYRWIIRRPLEAPIARAIDIDFMLRGMFYASSIDRNDARYVEYTRNGGWAESRNTYRHLSDTADAKPSSSGGDLAFEFESIEFAAGDYLLQGFFLVNRSGSTIYFPAQDSRLAMTIQAQDRRGKWRDIMYLPNSWCGNSYHTLVLPDSTYWYFSMPVFEGDLPTQLRLAVQFQTEGDWEAEEFTLYSDPIPGYVNTTQFTRKRDYTPRNIMDPYDD